jgi:hypothetical protein
MLRDHRRYDRQSDKNGLKRMPRRITDWRNGAQPKQSQDPKSRPIRLPHRTASQTTVRSRGCAQACQQQAACISGSKFRAYESKRPLFIGWECRAASHMSRNDLFSPVGNARQPAMVSPIMMGSEPECRQKLDRQLSQSST